MELSARAVVILDTCFSGEFIRENEMTTRTMPGRPKAELEGSVDRDLAKLGYIILASCEYDEYSYESTSLGHGIFTYFLLQGMASASFPAAHARRNTSTRPHSPTPTPPSRP